jgi:hypothetical protein
MSTTNIPTDLIREIHKQTTPELKAALEKALPDFFANKWETITSFETACGAIGMDPNDAFFSQCRPHENALRKYEVVCEAINEGITLDFANGDQDKWFVWVIWDKDKGGFRFVGAHYDYSVTYAGLGSRSLLASRERAIHVGKYFIDLINETLQ